MTTPPDLEYGAFIRVEDRNHKVVVTITQEELRRTLKMLLIQTRGDSDEALRLLKQGVIDRLSR